MDGDLLHTPHNLPECESSETQAISTPLPPVADNAKTGSEENEGVTTPFAADPTTSELPWFTHVSAPNYPWDDTVGESFSRSNDACYDEIVHWRRNVFKVPSGRTGKSFVRELTRMFHAFAEGSALERIALTAAMVMPALLLQKPHPKSKEKDHITHLECRLQLWAEGYLQALMEEVCTIQQQLTQQSKSQNRPIQQTALLLAKLMMEGKVTAGI